jgi:serine/threonine-protein kinase
VANHAIGQDALVGKTLGHYRIFEKIGAGGMGEVYRAQDGHLDREVAIKVLRPGTLADESSRKHFRKEALALSKLNHPNIATIHDFDTQQDVDFLVMEYIPGVTLSDRLKEASLPEKQVIALGMQLAEGLSAAHEHGVVHRDLKPGNLRLTGDGRLKILDFGLAKLCASSAASPASETLSETHAMAGTLPYMAPEQVLGGEIDARTDIHAVGAVLYEMATGRRAFPSSQRSQLTSAILRRSPRPAGSLNPRLSPELSRIIGKCLEKEPENRYQSAKELVVDLRRLQTGALTAQAPPIRPFRVWSARAVGLGVGVLALVIAFNVGGWRDRLLGRTGGPRIESLAVLPLANLSGDPQQEYFTDGLTEALIAELSQISSLKVISRTSAIQYKATKKSLPQIAAELHVDGVVEGTVQRSGDRVRITAELIYGPTDTHLWAQTYDHELHDILAVESSVASAIAQAIQVKLTPQEQAHLIAVRQVNAAAYEDYLRGRYEWNKRTAEGLRQAILFFQQAVAKDPRFAMAYAGLADSYLLLAYTAETVSPTEAVPKAKESAQKALALDRTLAEAHTTLGAIRFYYDWNWVGAEDEFQRAIKLKPSYATAHHWYGLYLEWMARIPEATSQLERAQQLDPLSPVISVNMSSAYYVARDYNRAVEQLNKALELDPNFWLVYWNLGDVLIALRQYPQAIADLQKAVELSGRNTGALAALGYAYAVGGDRNRADQVLRELTNLSKRQYVSPADLAYVEFGLGNDDQAFAWMEKAYQEHSDFLVRLKVDPLLDRVRPDPRFRDLLRRLNLSE